MTTTPTPLDESGPFVAYTLADVSVEALVSCPHDGGMDVRSIETDVDFRPLVDDVYAFVGPIVLDVFRADGTRWPGLHVGTIRQDTPGAWLYLTGTPETTWVIRSGSAF